MKNKIRSLFLTLGLGVLSIAAFAADNSSAQKVFFISPKDGATVAQKVKVKFGVEGMMVQPAGPQAPNTGHFHLIVDGAAIAKGQVVPKDATHIHYGKGQVEDTVNLAPGPHTLVVQFADGAHMSYGGEMSQTIRITVK